MPAIAGLALSNALQIMVFVQFSVRMWGEVNSQMSSVGQVDYYSRIDSEAPDLIPEKKPPINWPSEGNIEFKDLVMR